MVVTTSAPGSDKRVAELSVGAVDVDVDGQKSSSKEAYSVQIDADKQTVTITGSSSAGVFYGVQSLLALMDAEGAVPEVSIKDAPRFEYRGMHVDVARNFRTKEDILKVLGVMAMYKLNKFHFHLTDDEGWRLHIPGLEELTSVSSRDSFVKSYL